MSGLVPFQGSDMLTQIAMSRLMPKDVASEKQQLSLVGLIAGSTIETLSQCDARVSESFARKAEIISNMEIDQELKSQLLAQAAATSNAFSALLTKVGDASASLIKA
jgi:predicted RecB family nuclease